MQGGGPSYHKNIDLRHLPSLRECWPSHVTVILHPLKNKKKKFDVMRDSSPKIVLPMRHSVFRSPSTKCSGSGPFWAAGLTRFQGLTTSMTI